MTARCTSPFLTRPRGIASLTDTIMTSPTDAVLRLEPPSTLMHCTRRAPELSATSRLLSTEIIYLTPYAEAVSAGASDTPKACPLRSITCQVLRLLIGRHSSMRTVSPTLHRLLSSC